MMGEGLAKGVVLFNGTQKFNSTEVVDEKGNMIIPKNSYIKRSGAINSYDFLNNSNKMYGGLGGNQRGLQPVPGIIDMSVECLNRGSIRKATITLKAYNKFQFGLIELLYLRLGYSVMLEWGWDKYINEIIPGKDALTPPIVKIKDMESTIIENQWFDGNDYSQTDMINLVLVNEERFKGNYGGFFGKVTNFSWTLNPDNTYDITLNLITMGSVIESLNIKIPTANYDKGTIKAIQKKLNAELGLGLDTEKKIEESDNIILANVGSNKLSQWINTTILNFNLIRERTIKTTKDYILGTDIAVKLTSYPHTVYRDNIPQESKYFVRFETFLSYLQSNVIVDVINEGAEDKELGFELDSELVRCNYQTNLVPLNANKVIFSVLMDADVEIRMPDFNTTTSGRGNTAIRYMNRNMAKFATSKKGVVYGNLLNCYLNLTFIQQSFVDAQNKKEEVGLFVFLQKICDGINESTGNCTNLEVVLKNDKIIVIIDQNPIKGGDKLIEKIEDKTAINVYGYESQDGSSSFVKDFKFQTKITPDLMNMVTIGATASDEKNTNAIPFQKWNEGLINRFGRKQKYEEESPQKVQEISDNAFKEEFANAILTNAERDSSKGYKFKYGDIDLGYVYAGGIVDYDVYLSDSDRKKDSTNEALLSAGLNKYKRLLNILNTANKESHLYNILKNSAEAENNYAIYLSNAFGGKSGTREMFILGNGDLYYTTVLTFPKDALYFKWGNNDFIQQGKNAFKNYLSNINKKEAEALKPIISGTGFIPLEFDITMDGLSGIKIYNRLKINTKFLPSSYPRALKFIVKGVNHKVSNNVWNTNISTISVPISANEPPKSPNYVRKKSSTPTANTSSTGTKWEAGADVYIPSNNRVSYLTDITKQTRPVPVQKQLMDILANAAEECDVTIKISSAGNVPRPQRTNSLLTGDGVNTVNSLGSNRHDNGFAADFGIFYEGKRLNVAESVAPKAMEFLKAIRRLGVQSIGTGKNYMSGISVHADIAGGNSRTGEIYTCFTAGGQTNPISSWLPKFMAETRTNLNAPSGTFGGVKLIFNDRYA